MVHHPGLVSGLLTTLGPYLEAGGRRAARKIFNLFCIMDTNEVCPDKSVAAHRSVGWDLGRNCKWDPRGLDEWVEGAGVHQAIRWPDYRLQRWSEKSAHIADCRHTGQSTWPWPQKVSTSLPACK